MPTRKKLQPSEFEGKGLFRTGVQGIANAWEKLRVERRTGQDTSNPAGVDLDAEPNDYGTGGLRSTKDTL